MKMQTFLVYLVCLSMKIKQWRFLLSDKNVIIVHLFNMDHLLCWNTILCSSVTQLRCLPRCRRHWWKSSTPRCATSPPCTEGPLLTTWCVLDSCRARWTPVRSVLFHLVHKKEATIAQAIKLHFLTKRSWLRAKFESIHWWSVSSSSSLKL